MESEKTNINRYESDPSSLTTAQLLREIGSLKELLLTRVESVEQAIKIAHDDLVRVPTEVQKSVSTLKALHEEKFHSIAIQFKERDERVHQAALDTKAALDAALQAAKELVSQQNVSNVTAYNKQETSFSKQIDTQATLIMSTAKALDEKTNDLKDRLTRIEGQSTGRKDFWGYIVGAIGLIMGLISIFYFLSGKT